MNDRHPYEKVLRLMAFQKPIQVKQGGKWEDIGYHCPLNAILNSMGDNALKQMTLKPDDFREKPRTIQLGHWDLVLPSKASKISELSTPFNIDFNNQFFYWESAEQHDAFIFAITDLLNGNLL